MKKTDPDKAKKNGRFNIFKQKTLGERIILAIVFAFAVIFAILFKLFFRKWLEKSKQSDREEG